MRNTFKFLMASLLRSDVPLAVALPLLSLTRSAQIGPPVRASPTGDFGLKRIRKSAHYVGRCEVSREDRSYEISGGTSSTRLTPPRWRSGSASHLYNIQGNEKVTRSIRTYQIHKLESNFHPTHIMYTEVPVNYAGSCGVSSCNCGDACSCKAGECKC